MANKKKEDDSKMPRKKVQVHLFRRLASGEIVFLMLQRTTKKDSIWQCVTGNVDPGEELDACARREVREETGLALTGDGVGEVWQYEFSKGDMIFEEHVFGFEAGGEDVTLSHEHEACKWVGADEAMNLIHYEGIRKGFRRVLKALGRP
jgi:8-oxo-dGTP pyrophosphatase MutT (NUDIX family)